MSILSVLENRRSVAVLSEPAPNDEELAEILRVAQFAPDHGWLRPWQFLLIRGEARVALGNLYLKAALAETPELSEAQQTRIVNLPMRSPLIIVAVAKVLENHKVPVLEQTLAVAAAVQNILLALEAFHYSAMWRTGEMAYKTLVKQGLGLEPSDEIVAYLYVGTAGMQPKARKEQALEAYCREWKGPLGPDAI